MSTWTNDTYHFWGEIECDELFLLFDTSAHQNHGDPDVEADEVVGHVDTCETCRDHDVRITVSADGFEMEF